MNWYKTALKFDIGKKGLSNTWQGEFPEKTKCCRCGAESRVGAVFQEEGGQSQYICDLHDNEGPSGKYWLHDSCAVAIYFCTKCLETTSLYNQA